MKKLIPSSNAVEVDSNGDITFNGRVLLPMGEVSYFDTTGTAVVISAQSDGSTNMVKAAATTTLNADCSCGFDNGGSDNGRLRYIETVGRVFHVACTITIAPEEANDTFVFGIAKNGVVEAASKVLVKVINASDSRSTAMHCEIDMNYGDYLELYVGNITDAGDCNVRSLNIFAMGM